MGGVMPPNKLLEVVKLDIANRLVDLTQKRFGRLTALYRADNKILPSGQQQTVWHCKCDCGNEKDISGSELQKNATQSCGCLQRELASKRRKKFNTYDLSGDYGIGHTTKGDEFYFDLEDYDKIKSYCWRKRKDKYLDAKLCDETQNRILMHRLILADDSEIDHISGVRYDNRKNNLRYAEINGLNKNNQNKILQSNNKSGVTGVGWHSRDNVWETYISINHKQIYLGRFSDFNEAVEVRKVAEEKYYGEWSLDNSRNNKRRIKYGY